MSKSVLIINSSFRKKNTYKVLTEIEQILRNKNIDVEIISLFDYKIESCIGCRKCLTEGDCCFEDDMNLLMKKMTDSDGLVLSSPVYVGTVNGKFKTMVDRTCKWYHRPELAGKPILFAATTEATGLKDIKKCFETIAMEWGSQKAGFIARSSGNITAPVQDRELTRFLELLNQGKSCYKPSFYEINIFQVQKVLALKTNELDKQFWKDNQWLDKVYYYKCNINLLKRVFSNLIFKLLFKVMD